MPSIPASIVADIRKRLEDGSLAPGDRLPSTRALADELGTSNFLARASCYPRVRAVAFTRTL